MKPYLESVRRLSRVGLIFLVLCVIASMAISMQFCMRSFVSSIPSMMQMFLPVIVYMFIGGAALALDGFSFLNKRSDSDYYHSLPVSRRRLFWSITLAALTWLAATVFAGVIISVIVFTFSHTPFVASYALIAVPFCITGGMLVFAAVSIGMSLTGTWVSNIAMALLVLGLPRFLQFVVSRGILAKFSMMNWLDLPWYLTPVTNVATGQILSFTHNLLQTRLYNMANIGYSLLVAAAELVLACLLFIRRPSELAEHSAKNAKLQTLYACLTVLPVGILFASGAVSTTFANVLIVSAAALALYAIEQIVMFRNSGKVLRSLPWVLIPAVFSVMLFFGIRVPANAFKNDVPLIQDVAYVQFPGSGRDNGVISYDEYVVSQVKFTDQDVKDYVLSTLRANVASVDSRGFVNYQTDSHFTTLEPVTIVLNNGRKIGRIVWFPNSNTLNALRDENAEYSRAIRSLPPEDSICYQQTYDVYNPKYQKIEPIVEAYYADIQSTGIVPDWAYNQHSDTDDYSMEGKQSFGSLYLSGYVGTQRYSDYYEIRRETPTAAAAWMTWQNSHSTDEYFDTLKQISARTDAFLSQLDYLDCSLSFYNVPLSNGTRQFNSFYYSRSATDTTKLNSSFEPLATELFDIISRSEPTTDPNAFCVYFTWSGRATDENGAYVGQDIIDRQAEAAANAVATGSSVPFSTWGNVVYYSSDGNPMFYYGDGTILSYNPSYRAFSAADESRVIELLKQWQALQKKLQFSYNESAPKEITIQNPGVIYATPTPVPAPND